MILLPLMDGTRDVAGLKAGLLAAAHDGLVKLQDGRTGHDLTAEALDAAAEAQVARTIEQLAGAHLLM